MLLFWGSLPNEIAISQKNKSTKLYELLEFLRINNFLLFYKNQFKYWGWSCLAPPVTNLKLLKHRGNVFCARFSLSRSLGVWRWWKEWKKNELKGLIPNLWLVQFYSMLSSGIKWNKILYHWANNLGKVRIVEENINAREWM